MPAKIFTEVFRHLPLPPQSLRATGDMGDLRLGLAAIPDAPAQALYVHPQLRDRIVEKSVKDIVAIQSSGYSAAKIRQIKSYMPLT